jgi:putative FmdB family regulatory protein
MPTYEYVCKACGHELENFAPMSAKPLTKCPECGKAKLERKIGVGAGVLFKGGGFYETDYRSDSYKKSAEADKPAPAGHTHTDSCACGKKTKTECASEKATPVKAEKPKVEKKGKAKG